jgi:hypothetical protein
LDRQDEKRQRLMLSRGGRNGCRCAHHAVRVSPGV